MKAVPTRVSRSTRALVAALLTSTSLMPAANAQQGLPTGGQVVSGSATIATNGPSMEINQSSDAMIANWQTFSIGAGNSVTFNQPDARSIAMNRVIGQDPSQILGNLIANGRVFLLNPNGIVIGKDGRVQTGGFVASTLGLSDSDFLRENYRFTGAGGTILNQGDLKGGVVALIAPRVSNEGTIAGDAALAGGTDVTLDFNGDGLISVEVSASSVETLIENKGLIQADGGLAILTAKGANEAMKGVVNNSGVIEAASLEHRDGRVLLLGDMEHGEVNAGGTLAASFVETSAAQVNIADDVQVKTGGGKWLIDPGDFTIAASGGNMTGATLTANLANGNVDITTLGRGSNADIFVNDSITWSSHTLTLDADRNITINAPLFGSGTAGLTLAFAQRSTTGDYFINAPVNLASTGNFTTFENTSNGNLITRYTIITSLGSVGSMTGTDLQGIEGNLSGNYVLGADIDAAATVSWNGGAGFAPIGDVIVNGTFRFFSGRFDGLGHTISGLTIVRPTENYVGLFETVSGGGTISNLNIRGGRFEGNAYVGSVAGANDGTVWNVTAGANVHGSSNVGGLFGLNSDLGKIDGSAFEGNINAAREAGGLVGENDGEISNSQSAGSLNGNNSLGGLVGTNRAGSIRNSYADVDVTGTGNHVGGLAANNFTGGVIANSFATGDVTGADSVGGLVGVNHGGIVTNSYAAGRVAASGLLVGGLTGRNGVGGMISTSFFDTQATGQSGACGDSTDTAICNATGLTTAQMKTSAPFIAAGWDFDTIWAIDPAINNGYPYLRATVAPTIVVAPPPPLPPPVVVLAVNDFGSSFSTSTVPFQPTISLTGTGFSAVTEVRFTWTDPNGVMGSAIFNAANNFGGGRFVVGADGNSATISPVLVAANDPTGTYQWSVTFVSGTQTVTRNFAVIYTAVVTPPPPPPPAPVTLAVNDFGMTFSTTTAPFRPDIPISGTGFAGVTEVRFFWTDPNGQTGMATFTAANEFRGPDGVRRFVVGADGNSATISPILVASDDPSGTYQWSVTFVAGAQSVARNFAVTYTAVVTPPPPPPPQIAPLSLTSGIDGFYATGTVPYRQTFNLSGQGFAGITTITLTWTDPTGRTGTITRTAANNNFDGRFTVDQGGNSAQLSTVLVDDGDPPGAYRWTITLTNGNQTVTRNFIVSYGAASLDEPVVQGPTENPNSLGGWLSGEAAQELQSIITDPYPLFPRTAEHVEAARLYGIYAIMSNNVYGDGLLPLPGWRVEHQSDSLIGTINGFYAETYVHTNNNGIIDNVVIAFRGTDGIAAINDHIFGNIFSSSTLGTGQFGTAERYYRQIAGIYGDSVTIKLTGHSLGGALAQYVSDKFSVEAVVFNSSPRGGTSGVNIEETGDLLDVFRRNMTTDISFDFTASGDHSIYSLAVGMAAIVK